MKPSELVSSLKNQSSAKDRTVNNNYNKSAAVDIFIKYFGTAFLAGKVRNHIEKV